MTQKRHCPESAREKASTPFVSQTNTKTASYSPGSREARVSKEVKRRGEPVQEMWPMEAWNSIPCSDQGFQDGGLAHVCHLERSGVFPQCDNWSSHNGRRSSHNGRMLADDGDGGTQSRRGKGAYQLSVQGIAAQAKSA